MAYIGLSFWMWCLQQVSAFYVYMGLFLVSLILTYYTFTQVRKEEEKDWNDHGVRSPDLPKNYFNGPDFRTQFSNLITEYGDTIGYKGRKNLTLLTTNLGLLRNILIKDFSNFVDRGESLTTSSPFGKSLFFARGNDWRRQRRIVSPAFSTGKLRNIAKSVDVSAKALSNYFLKFAQDGNVAAIKDACSRFTCEVIAKTAFGIKANFIAEENSDFYNHAKNIILFTPKTGISRYIFMYSFRIPFFVKLCLKFFKLQFFDPVSVEATNYFRTVLKSTTREKRRQMKDSKKLQLDILDLLLQSNEAVSNGQLDKEKEEREASVQGGPLEKLTAEEILGHSMLIIFGGLETTATTLQMCLYSFAVHPDIQDKVYHEIQSVVQSESPTPEELTKLVYTDQVINETLRMYQPVPIVRREAKETRTYDDITIPRGALVIIPYYHILKDPKIYPDPETFNPDRFSPEEKVNRDPLSFVSFGHGPRICLGMRLAYLELRVALVHVLRKLKVILNDKTEPKRGEEKVEFTAYNLLTPTKPIRLAFELRNTDNSDQVI